MKKFYLLPGAVFADRKPHIVDTILGSCIAVVLWDAVLQFGSINHFMLPQWNGEGTPANKYGDVAIINLIKQMEKLGSLKANLRAKVFGGSVTHNSNGIFQIGQRNAEMAFALLKNQGVPVVNYSVGGKQSRKIIFYSQTGDVLVKFLKPLYPATTSSLNANIHRP
ncbi:chemotaxis protein CheD [Mucilaginibacter lacusdianchii]|uniref:chemotaxis protein CheD n=1 Tax=Mucilaginibacter lacusdianchii TaxID=2684211 RepID=UPI00131D99E2|nr:chemotaxis protein CheD [Mucilaginibacter sp. JXJ CY 39]